MVSQMDGVTQGVNFDPAAAIKGDLDPHIALAMIKNVWIKQMYFVHAGDTMQGHRHPHDHATLLATGAMRVTVNGESTDFTAPKVIWIAADYEHELVALKAHTVAYCIHAMRNGDGVEDIIDPESIPAGTKRYSLPSGVKPFIRTEMP